MTIPCCMNMFWRECDMPPHREKRRLRESEDEDGMSVELRDTLRVSVACLEINPINVSYHASLSWYCYFCERVSC